MLNVVLFEPEIPSNTGNIGRTCVVTGARLHLIRPFGFELSDPLLKRAGMAYWPNLQVDEYAGWDDFLARNPGARLHLLTKRGARTYAESTYRDGDFLVFGKESTGIDRRILDAHPDLCERIPMLPDAASLDNAAAWHAHHERLARGAGADGATGGQAAGTGETAGSGAAAAGADGMAGSGGQAPGVGGTTTSTGSAPAFRTDICGNFVDDATPQISSLNLSNSVAIVLYEALRQTGFPGM